MEEMEEKKKISEEELLELLHYTRGLIDASPDIMILTDMEGIIKEVNQQAVDTLGVPKEKLIGSYVVQYFTDPDRAQGGIAKVTEKEWVRNFEMEMIGHKGNHIPVSFNAVVYRDRAGKAAGIYAVARDISEMKRTTEQLLSQQQAILELSTPVIHLWDEIVLLPLIGTIDTRRAQQIMENLLQAIVSKEAQVVIIDIAGVPVIDTRVAKHLITTIQAAGMLGARTILTGISPNTAQTMTRLGIDFSEFICKGSLRTGVIEAFKSLDLEVVKAAQPQRYPFKETSKE